MDWKILFEAAALDMSRFRPADPRWVPVTFADQRLAWEGELPEQPGQTLRVEAASFAGKPVSFIIAGPWSRSARTPAPPAAPTLLARFMTGFTSLVLPGLMIAAAILARHNVKLGRGDRRGAFRAAAVLFWVRVAAWLVGVKSVGVLAQDITRFFTAMSSALLDAALLWITYLAVEPYIRKLSPDSLIGWTRLIGGRWRDPLVARDILIGVSAGLAMTVIYGSHNLIPPLFGRPEPMPLVLSDTTCCSARGSFSPRWRLNSARRCCKGCCRWSVSSR